MEMNVDKTKAVRFSKKTSTVQTTIDEKQLENVEYFNCLFTMVTNDARCICEIKSTITMLNEAFNDKKTFSPPDWT
jgi:hypothetical protein